MQANVIIAVAAIAVTLFTVIFIVVEQQMGYEDDALYYGTAEGGGHSFNFAKTAAGPFVSWSEEEVGKVLIASVEGDADDMKFAKIIWNADGSLSECDVEPTDTQETIGEWQASASPASGMGFVDPVTGVEYIYTVTEGEAPEDWIPATPTTEECRVVAQEAFDNGRDRFMTETLDDAERSLSTYEARLASDAYKRATYEVGNAAVLVENCRFAFRGSDDWRDWYSNIVGSLWSWRVNGQMMHGGFATEFYRVQSSIHVQVHKCGRNAKWVGHSLGGSMANVARQHYGFGGTYTYGAPAAYNHRSRRFHGIRLWHDCDPVPSWAIAFGRHHAHGSTKIYNSCLRRAWWGWCRKWGQKKRNSGYDSKSWFGGSFSKHNVDNYKNMS